MPENTSEDNKDKIMHASLKSGSISFFASDAMPESAVNVGTNVSLCLGGSDEAALTEAFNKLSQSGQVVSPLKKEAWGDTFGMFTDKFGINWMVNISAAKSQE
jgi:PhnB protein